MASYKQTVRNTFSSAWLGKELDCRELALVKSYNNYTSVANTRSALTANVTYTIKNTLDEVPHNQSYSEVYNEYMYIIKKGGRKIENNTNLTQEKAWKRSDAPDKFVQYKSKK
jgi:hypothetical protein